MKWPIGRHNHQPNAPHRLLVLEAEFDIMKTSRSSDLWRYVLFLASALFFGTSAIAAPYAVYRVNTVSSTSEAGTAFIQSAQHILVIDLNPTSSEAAVMAMIVPTIGAYITNKMIGYGGHETTDSRGRKRTSSAISINIKDHPLLADFQATLTGKGSKVTKILTRSRRGGNVKIRGASFTIPPATSVATVDPEVFVGSFSGNGAALSEMQYDGTYVALDSVTTSTLRARFDYALTALANQDQGVFIPRVRALPAVQVSSVQAVGSSQLWLRQILLADGHPPSSVTLLDADCDDGFLNGDETGIDCGGSCLKCPAGVSCLSNSDCASGVCQNNVCASTTCDDGILNGNETGIDCGGSCGGCGLGQACETNADCAEGACHQGVCTQTFTWYRDADGDGWGNWNDTVQAVLQPAGYVAQGGDCNDAGASMNPGSIEVCNGIDDNCDGIIDEGC